MRQEAEYRTTRRIAQGRDQVGPVGFSSVHFNGEPSCAQQVGQVLLSGKLMARRVDGVEPDQLLQKGDALGFQSHTSEKPTQLARDRNKSVTTEWTVVCDLPDYG